MPWKVVFSLAQLCLVSAAAFDWVECMGRDAAFAEKVSLLDLQVFRPVDENYLKGMHGPEASYCTLLSWDLKEEGPPAELLLITRLYFANPIEMQILWDGFDERMPTRLYPYPLSLDNEFKTLDLVKDRLKSIEDESQVLREKANAQGLAKILNSVIVSLREACEVRSAAVQKTILQESLKNTLKVLVQAKRWELKRSLEEYYGLLLDLISPDQCDFGAGKYRVSFAKEIRSSPTYSPGPIVIRVAETHLPIYNTSLRGLITAPASSDVRAYLEGFGRADYGGYMTVVKLNCGVGIECMVDENQLFAAYHRVMAAALTFAPVMLHETSEEQSMLCLGLGGGELVKFLLKHHHNLKIDVIEIDGNIVDLAKQYFYVDPCAGSDCKLNIIVKDAWAHLEHAVSSRMLYDYVLCDLFDAGVIDAGDNGDSNVHGISSEKNIENLSKIIKPINGIAVLHIHNGSNFSAKFEMISRHFNSSIVLVSGGSYIVIASRNLPIVSTEESLTGSSEIKSTTFMNPCHDFAQMGTAIMRFAKANDYGKQIAFGMRYSPFCDFHSTSKT